jgi:hypothetical protein
MAALIAYVQRSAISVPAKIIQQELDMDAASMGLVMAVWYWGYALFQGGLQIISEVEKL